MTGPEHYRRAEQIIRELEDSAPHTPVEWHAARSAQAQVHAILALAAATVEQTGSRGPGDISSAWSDLVWPTVGDA